MKLLILSVFVGLCVAGPLAPLPPLPSLAPFPAALPAFYRGAPDYYNRYNPYYYQQVRPRAGVDASAAIVRSDAEVGDQGFRYAYETTNGIRAEASGVEANGIQTQGSYSYTGDDGQVYSVRYTAGADGFRPEGAHLPTPPPIPEAILRSLEQNARDEASGVFDDGSYKAGKYDAFPAAVRDRYYNNNYFRPRYNLYNRNY